MFGEVRIRHPCLAKRALLKQSNSRKPRSPKILSEANRLPWTPMNSSLVKFLPPPKACNHLIQALEDCLGKKKATHNIGGDGLRHRLNKGHFSSPWECSSFPIFKFFSNSILYWAENILFRSSKAYRKPQVLGMLFNNRHPTERTEVVAPFFWQTFAEGNFRLCEINLLSRGSRIGVDELTHCFHFRYRCPPKKDTVIR